MANRKPEDADTKAPPNLRPLQTTDEDRDPDQAWFWTEEWQEGEREIDEDIRAGRVKTFDTMEEFLASLDSDDD